ncbi:hypothetical protein [Paraburkholderia phytofirmans]|uniref:hypothetical protein n=1 Tax=Paraburkholderia phytofirmans TaxID=261302 RepID=UPI0038B8DEC2
MQELYPLFAIPMGGGRSFHSLRPLFGRPIFQHDDAIANTPFFPHARNLHHSRNGKVAVRASAANHDRVSRAVGRRSRGCEALSVSDVVMRGSGVKTSTLRVKNGSYFDASCGVMEIVLLRRVGNAGCYVSSVDRFCHVRHDLHALGGDLKQGDRQ